jgi:hypothetical protein
MAAGYQVTLADINNTAGRICVATRVAFADVVTFKTWLDSKTDNVLTGAPINMVQADLDVLRSAFVDLNQLNNIRVGSVNLVTAKDFTAFSKQLTGVL